MIKTVTTMMQADPSLTWIPVSALLVLFCWSIGSALGDTVVVTVQAVQRVRRRMTARGKHAAGAS